MTETWGPWMPHSGLLCPCRVGETVQTFDFSNRFIQGEIHELDINPDLEASVDEKRWSFWIWKTVPLARYPFRVKEYRRLILKKTYIIGV